MKKNNSEILEEVLSKYNFQELCEIKVKNNIPTFSYENYTKNKDIDQQKKSVYLWVIKENDIPVEVIYVGLIDKSTIIKRNKLHETGFKGKGNGGSKSGEKLKNGIIERMNGRKIVIYLRKSDIISVMDEYEISIHHIEEFALIKKFNNNCNYLLNDEGYKRRKIEETNIKN